MALLAACWGVAGFLAPPWGEAPVVPGSAWEGAVRGELAWPAPVGPNRVLVVLAHDLPPPPPSLLGGYPLWAGARRLRVRGPADLELARSCWLTGVDTARDRPPGSPRPEVPLLPTLVDRAWDQRISLHIYGGDTLLGPRDRKVRLREWVAPGSRIAGGAGADADSAGATIARVRRRLGWQASRPGDRELWVVELFGQGAEDWPAQTQPMLLDFLNRGERGRSLALVVGRPEGGLGERRGQAEGLVVGFMAPGQPAVSVELEDVAPSVAAMLGLAIPDGAQGVPRLDLFVPRDLPGAYVALTQGFPAALARRQALHRALERPAPPLPDFGPAERFQAEGAVRDAVSAALRAREDLRLSIQSQARTLREAWRRGGRGESFALLYGLCLGGLALLLGGLWTSLGRGGLAPLVLGPFPGILAVLWLHRDLAAAPHGVWNALCSVPEQGTLMGLAVATAGLAAVIPCAWRLGARLGAAVAAASGLACAGLVSLAVHWYRYGPLEPWALLPPEVLVQRAWIGGFLVALPVAALVLELFLAVLAWCERRG